MGCPCAGCNPKPTPSLRLPNGNYALGCLCENRELHILDSPGCTGNFATAEGKRKLNPMRTALAWLADAR